MVLVRDNAQCAWYGPFVKTTSSLSVYSVKFVVIGLSLRITVCVQAVDIYKEVMQPLSG